MKPVLGSQIQVGHPLSTGLVGCWLMNEGSGSRVNDLSGNNNNLTGYNSPAWSPGNSEHSVLLVDASSQYFETDITALGYDSPRTIACWFLIDEDEYWSTHQIVFVGDKDNTNHQEGLWISKQGTGSSMTFSAVRNTTASSIATPIVANTWYFGCGVFNGPSYRQAFLNGVAATAETSTVAQYYNYDRISVGRHGSSGPTYYFSGKIGTATVWNRALSASEIAWLYREPFAMFQRRPIELWTAATGGAAATYTGSGSGIATKATGSASATFTVPVYTGSGSPSATKATAAASGTFTVPVYTGSGSPSATKATGSASATYTVPVYTGSGSPSVTKATAAASGTFAIPVYSGVGGATIQQPTASASGLFSTAVYVGSGSGTAAKTTAAAAATYTVPVYAGSGSPSATKATAAASATYTVPVYAGSGSPSATKATAAASGTFTVPVYTGVGIPSVTKAIGYAAGMFTVPVYMGMGDSIVSKTTASADGTFLSLTPTAAVAACFVILKRRH